MPTRAELAAEYATQQLVLNLLTHPRAKGDPSLPQSAYLLVHRYYALCLEAQARLRGEP